MSSRHAHGPVFVAETYAPPDALPTPAGTAQDGRLLSARPYHSVSAVANISAYEKKHDPDKQGFDSNPYAVLAQPGVDYVHVETSDDDEAACALYERCGFIRTEGPGGPLLRVYERELAPAGG